MPRRKQDRPLRMKWEDGGGQKLEIAGGESPSSGCNGQDAVYDLSEQSETNNQSTHSNDVTPSPMELGRSTPIELNGNETGSVVYSSKESSLDSTSGCQSRCFTLDGNYLVTGPMAKDLPLDFSLRSQNQSSTLSLNLSPCSLLNGVPSESQNEPLDLSVPNRRKSTENCFQELKLARVETPSPINTSATSYSSLNFSSDHISWNENISYLEGSKAPRVNSRTSHSPVPKPHLQTSSAQSQLLSPSFNTSNMANALDKMNALCHTVTKMQGIRTGSRHNPWKNQWINKIVEPVKEVFTCVWCRDPFKSLSEMAVHMQQSPKCGMAPVPSISPNTNIFGDSPSSVAKCSTSSTDNSLVIKESMPLPRKLVRGQDVWLGKGAEQTRQILKCMWCGQSFKTLADMTNHMRVTQHYNNIISQEQIISWKVPVDKVTSQSQLNAVLTCKVCNQVFGSLKELSYHMMKNTHYKEHILRSVTEDGVRRKQTRERRKKSLPVKKLLQLERMEMNKMNVSKEQNEQSKSKSENVSGMITCEECAEKVEAKDFVTHIKNCAQSPRSHHILKNALTAMVSENEVVKESKSDYAIKVQSNDATPKEEMSRFIKSPTCENSENSTSKEEDLENSLNNKTCKKSEPTSVLNAIEKLIEKSFDNRSVFSKTGYTGILQRLGIDVEAYPPCHPPEKSGQNSTFKSRVSCTATSSTGTTVKKTANINLCSISSEFAYNHNVVNNNVQKSSFSINKERGILNKKSEPSSDNTQHTSSLSSTSEPKNDSSTLKSSNSELTPYQNTFSEEFVEEENHNICYTRGQTESPVTNHTDDSFDVYSEVDQSNTISNAYKTVENVSKISRSQCQMNAIMCRSEAEPTNISFQDKGKSSPSLSDTSKLSLVNLNPKSEKNNSQHSNDVEKSATGHPLRELQKLLDKTHDNVSRSGIQSPPGSILAFSWACNDAKTSDSLMKCAFCDTHFISKGAYRHHLSKIHFVKDANIPDVSGGKVPSELISVTKESPPPSMIPEEESPHSKFLKYTELAKQLSSKYM
ncbi:protein tiptop-like [Limulus polyphemus]|uniref:Protein tiptop-like n=1 Tax=Limulus polyphemus TaxID=6850 RepID=A0ABM1SRL5_LIMPO|nr:protein tiptop-like [Limulus polyphemus]